MSTSTSSLSVSDPPSPPSSPEAEAEADHFINPIPPHQPNSPSPSFFMASSYSLGVGWYKYNIIETLADSKADLPLLKELVNRVPSFYTDAPESVQERVALRYLQECASRGRGRGIVHTKDNTPGATAIDISQSTVDFLCHNLTKSMSTLQLAIT